MSNPQPLKPFRPNAPDAADVITWVHIGDLHMTLAGEQNHRDLTAIVDEINSAFAPSIAFVFIPGDVADHGNAAEYTVVRGALDALIAPWCSIVGDHDVHEKSFEDQLPPEGIHDLLVKIGDANGRNAEDRIRCVFGESAYQAAERKDRDQDNAVEAWPERGLLGTQLGPNKNGRKW